jgi:phytoene synthase
MHFEAERAKEYYRKAKALIPNQDRPALIASEIMGAIYYRLLMTIEKRGYNVFTEAIRLSSFHKMVIALWTWCRIKLDQSVA